LGGSGITTAKQNLSFSITSPTVFSGESVWFVLGQNTTLNDLGVLGNGVNWYRGTMGTGGRAFDALNGSGGAPPPGAWTLSSGGSPFAFLLQGTIQVPEPGQVAMGGLLLLGVGACAWRKFRPAQLAVR
jgi:hypothetical protein